MLVACLMAIPACDRLPTGPADRSGPAVRGMTLADWTAEGYGTPEAGEALAALAATGANTVTIIVTAYQNERRSSAIHVDPLRTPSMGALRSALTVAANLGLEIALKPHVDLEDGSWRGHIEPQDPETWFASYRSFIVPLAALAESINAAQFVVGTELAGTLRDRAQWIETIRQVRAAYSGPLVYAASWDEAQRVPFWEELDLVGVDAYFPVAVRRNPNRLDILAGWQPWLVRLDQLHRQTDRPVLLTEIGYRSIDGAGRHPYDLRDRGTPDLDEQADLYWGALEATTARPGLAGMYWWNWSIKQPAGPEDTGYTPRGKPAALELTAAWRPSP